MSQSQPRRTLIQSNHLTLRFLSSSCWYHSISCVTVSLHLLTTTTCWCCWSVMFSTVLEGGRYCLVSYKYPYLLYKHVNINTSLRALIFMYSHYLLHICMRRKLTIMRDITLNTLPPTTAISSTHDSIPLSTWEWIGLLLHLVYSINPPLGVLISLVGTQ